MTSTFKSSNDLSLYNPNLTKSKWQHRAPSVDANVAGQGAWASSHMYRTSSNDIDTIITSILDSGIDNSPSPVPSPAKQAHKSPVNVKKQPVIGTFQNYETRKKNLINEARERFLSKNQL